MNKPDAFYARSAEAAIADAVKAMKNSAVCDDRIESEDGRDIKLAADLFLSRELVARLTASTGFCCITEEDIQTHGLLTEEPVWIVDPLDGSMNFSRRIPLYCISVALWRGGKPVLGVIMDIVRRRTFVVHNRVARVSGKKIHVSTVEFIERAVLATGFPLLSDTSVEGIGWFINIAGRFKKVRMIGSAALSLAWVAEGRMDAYFERDIMLWDIAGGAALVEGAGGICVIKPGRYPMSVDVLAANKKIAREMRNLLKW